MRSTPRPELGRDIHENQRADRRRLQLTGDQQRDHAPERSAHQRRLWPERLHHADEVTREGIRVIVTLLAPIAVTVAAQIERDGVEPGAGKHPGGSSPRVPRLTPAVQQQHRFPRGISPSIGRNLHSAAHGDAEMPSFRIVGIGSHQGESCAALGSASPSTLRRARARVNSFRRSGASDWY
jgi:hypothetical protein